ncbi:MAG: hypothetical protein ACE5I7_11400, partial [Candidatus Binatia bacterium]
MGSRHRNAVVIALAAAAGAAYLTVSLAAGQRGYGLLVVLTLTWIAAAWSLSPGVPAAWQNRSPAVGGSAHRLRRNVGIVVL